MGKPALEWCLVIKKITAKKSNSWTQNQHFLKSVNTIFFYKPLCLNQQKDTKKIKGKNSKSKLIKNL